MVWRALAGLVCLVLAACGSIPMRDQTIAYNEAVADSTNQFFLLNVLRARDRFPLYYTRTTGNSASQGQSAGVATDIDNWHFLPTLASGASSSNALSLANLDDQKFMRGVLTPVPLATLGFYLDQGWPKEVVMDMFISNIEIDRTLVMSLTNTFSERCRKSGESESYCAKRRPIGAGGEAEPSPAAYVLNECMPGDGKTVTFDNDPSDAKSSQCFRGMLRVLIALGLDVSTGDSYTVIVPHLPAQSAFSLEGVSRAQAAKLVIEPRPDGAFAVCSTEEASAFTLGAEAFETDVSQAAAGGFFDSPGLATTSLVSNLPQSCADAAAARSKPAVAATAPRPVFRFSTRSLDSMLYFLGEDVRKNGAVTVWTGHGERQHEMPLFLVESGSSGLVSIDYRGSTYAIPDQCGNDTGCEQHHRSLQVLSLLNQIWGLQKEATEAPTVPVVSVINR